jgi:hypothetical protein
MNRFMASSVITSVPDNGALPIVGHKQLTLVSEARESASVLSFHVHFIFFRMLLGYYT